MIDAAIEITFDRINPLMNHALPPKISGMSRTQLIEEFEHLFDFLPELPPSRAVCEFLATRL